jgi:hypothetical protein
MVTTGGVCRHCASALPLLQDFLRNTTISVRGIKTNLDFAWKSEWPQLERSLCVELMLCLESC